jgi:hypothetical protein
MGKGEVLGTTKESRAKPAKLGSRVGKCVSLGIGFGQATRALLDTCNHYCVWTKEGAVGIGGKAAGQQGWGGTFEGAQKGFEIFFANCPGLAFRVCRFVPKWESAERTDAALQKVPSIPRLLHTSSSSKPKQPIEGVREAE